MSSPKAVSAATCAGAASAAIPPRVQEARISAPVLPRWTVDELRQGERPPLGLEVEPLPAHHALDPAGLEQLRRHPAQDRGRQAELVRGLREHPGGHRHEQEADPGGGRHVERAVGGRAAAAEVVVVHARQVVVDERVGVHGLDRRGHAGDAGRVGRRPSRNAAEHQRGAHPLAGGAERVGEGFAVAGRRSPPGAARPSDRAARRCARAPR